MSAPRNAAERLLRLERILAHSKISPASPAADDSVVAAHFRSAPTGRIQQLTSELQQRDGHDNDEIDAVAMRLLLSDYETAVGHLRSVARAVAAVVGNASVPIREAERLIRDSGVPETSERSAGSAPDRDASPEVGPNVLAVKIESAFSLDRCSPGDGTTVVSRDPLTLRTQAGSHAMVGALPAREGAFESPDRVPTLGWVVRVRTELVSGGATLAFASADLHQTFGKAVVRPGVQQLDLMLRDPSRTHLVIKGGGTGTTELKLLSVDCYRLVDEETGTLSAPPALSLAPEPRWWRFYGEPKRLDDLAAGVRFARFTRLTEPRSMHWMEGLTIDLVPGEQISQAVYVSGLYEPCTLSTLQRILKPGDTFLDVGANIGLVSMLASRWVGPDGRVVSIEPSRREFDRLQRHVDHNSLTNVRTVRAAVGHSQGTVVLHVATPDRSGLNTLEQRFKYDDVKEAYTESVSITRLDDLILEQGVQRVDVIKIDVEGGEDDVVRGARQTIAQYRPTLILEAGGTASTASGQGEPWSLEAFLRSLGYQFIAIDGETATLRRVSDLSAPTENFLIVQPDVLDALGRHMRVLG